VKIRRHAQEKTATRDGRDLRPFLRWCTGAHGRDIVGSRALLHNR
jgi:hypothetical protein